ESAAFCQRYKGLHGAIKVEAYSDRGLLDKGRSRVAEKSLAAWLSIVTLSCALPDRGAAEPMTWPCQGRCFDAAILWRNGYALLFKGNQFWRYDIARDKVDLGENTGYPRPVRVFAGLPQSWLGGFDAALNGGDGKVYWFKGGQYVRYDLASLKVDAGPLPTSNQWPGLPPAWTAGFNAAVNWGNGKLIFFKGR